MTDNSNPILPIDQRTLLSETVDLDLDIQHDAECKTIVLVQNKNVTDVKLWWPHTHKSYGSPFLYDTAISLVGNAGHGKESIPTGLDWLLFKQGIRL